MGLAGHQDIDLPRQGISVEKLTPTLIDRGSVEVQIRNQLMGMAGNTVLALHSDSMERWTATGDVEITQAEIRCKLARVREWLEITVPELESRMDEVMNALNDVRKAVIVRFAPKIT